MRRLTKGIQSAGLILAVAAGQVTPAAAQDGSGTRRGISIYGGFSWERTPRFLLDTVDGSTTIGNTTSSSRTGSPRSHGMIGGELTVAVPVSHSISLLASGSWQRSSSNNNELPGGNYRSITAQTILVIPNETGIRWRQTQLTAVAGAEYRLPHQLGHLSPFFRLQAGFAQVRAGGNGIDQQRTDINGLDGGRVSATSFTANLGAGLDLPIGRNVDLRLIQVDYRYVAAASRHLVSAGDRVDSHVTNFTGGSVVTSFQDVDARVSARHDIVIGAGIVVHFGR
jgi:hypothetical protein